MDDFSKNGMKTRGFAHVFAAFGHSMAGARVLLREEAVRLEALLFLVVAVLFAVAGAALWQWGLLLILTLWLLMVEALNTAIELIVDRTSPEISAYGKHTKDLGSFAVFCSLTVYCLYATWVVASGLLASGG